MKEIGLILIGLFLGLALMAKGISGVMDDEIANGYIEHRSQIYLIEAVDMEKIGEVK